jgi:plastocyanin domain-containing protein
VDATQWIVTLLGLAAIAWVNWYFFFAGRTGTPVTAAAGSGTQEVRVTVDGGYEPATIALRAGRPVRLLFDRRDSGSCTEEVVLPDFGIRRFLPTGSTTPVEFTPATPGTFEFSCGMGMVRGKLVVTGPAAGS